MSATVLNNVVVQLRHAARMQASAIFTDAQLLEQYVAQKNEAAFEAIVRRHGAMVLGVCRRILRNEADAEDAFQATFLVLVRKAVSIRSGGTLGNWLYGVAYNTALKAKAMNTRRRTKEREAVVIPKSQATEEVWRAVQAQLDNELFGLPEKFRIPIVLCDLEGKPIKEAARQLGWAQGTLASRLVRGRALLAKRLREHGLVLATGVLVAVLSHGAAAASLPGPLLSSTIKVTGIGLGGSAAGAVAPHVVALAEGVMQAMFLTKMKSFLAVTVIALAFVGIGGGLINQQSTAQDRPGAAPPFQSGIAQDTDDPVKLKKEIERLRAELAKTRLELKQAQYENIILKAQAELKKLQAEANRTQKPSSGQYPPQNIPASQPPSSKSGMSLAPGGLPGALPLQGIEPGAVPKGFGGKPGGLPMGGPGGMGLGAPPPGGLPMGGGLRPGGLPVGGPGGMGLGAPPMGGAKPAPSPMALAPDGGSAAIAKDTVPWVFDVRNYSAEAKVLFRVEGHSQPIVAVAFAPDGKTILTGSSDRVAMWNAATGMEIRRVSLRRPLASFRIDADGKHLVVHGVDGVDYRLELSTGKIHDAK